MRQTSALASKLASLSAALFALTLLVTVGVGKSCADDGAISISRESALGRALVGMEVYVNGEKLGTLKNGGKGTFKFESKSEGLDDGKDVLFLKIPGLTDAKSDRIRFGRAAIFQATYNAGLLSDSITVKVWDFKDGKWRDPK